VAKVLEQTEERLAEVKRLRAKAVSDRRSAGQARRRVDLEREKHWLAQASEMDRQADQLEISMGIVPTSGGFAYCWRTGRIGVGPRLPERAVPLARGPISLLRHQVEAASRHGYEKGVFLVPGVPEADTEDAALEAAKHFSGWAFSRPNLNPAFPKARQEAVA
jgi:hypothetical protein